MKIGFYIKWELNSINTKVGNVLGDELWAQSIVAEFKKNHLDFDVDIYGLNKFPNQKLDVLIYMNDTEPMEKYSKKHILYIQNGYNDNFNTINRLLSSGYDGFISFSNSLNKYLKDQKNISTSIYLPFGVNTDIFKPVTIDEKYTFECSYVGNDIKGRERTERYLMPAVKYNFGLYGNWDYKFLSKHTLRNYFKIPSYKKKMSKLSNGKISQELLPVLYSSSRINLNVTLQSCVDLDVVTLRTYEVLGCKGFLISDKVDFAVKNMEGCLVFNDGNKDLNDKIEYYLSRDKERKEIANNGYYYVMENATIEKIVEKLKRFIIEVY